MDYSDKISKGGEKNCELILVTPAGKTPVLDSLPGWGETMEAMFVASFIYSALCITGEAKWKPFYDFPASSQKGHFRPIESSDYQVSQI